MNDEQAREFLDLAYGGLLGRTPDVVGGEYYGRALRDGTITPAEVLRQIMASREFGNRNESRAEEIERFLKLSYQGLLGRPADMFGFRHYSRALAEGVYRPSDIIERIVDSSEYKSKQLVGVDYNVSEDAEFSHFVTPDVKRTSLELQSYRPLTLDEFVALSGRVLDIRQNYFAEHHVRFYEMICAIEFLKSLTPDRAGNVRLLEFGGDHTVQMLDAALSPGIDIYSSDIAFSPSLTDIVKDQYPLDLERHASRDAVLFEGGFDIISFCEVLEHLRASPTKVLGFLRNNLARDGVLYLTTPNFFRRLNVLAFWNRNAMQPVIPADLAFEHLHSHHVREYCAKEIFAFAAEAGLKLYAFYFSACWDAAAAVQPELEDQLSNMVFLFKRDDSN